MKLVSTLLGGESYWPGMRVLAHSLSHRGQIDGLDWLIYTDDGTLPDENWIRECGFNPIALPVSDLQKKLPRKIPGTKDRWKFPFVRLAIFDLPPGNYICLDADILVMRECRSLLDYPNFSACRNRAGRIAAGVMRFDSDPELFKDMVERMKRADYCNMADEDIIDHVFTKRHFTYMDWRFFVAAKDSYRNPKRWKPDEAYFIHYAAELRFKPWNRNESYKVAAANDIWRDYARENLS